MLLNEFTKDRGKAEVEPDNHQQERALTQEARQVGLQPIVAGMTEPVYSQVNLAADAFVRPKA